MTLSEQTPPSLSEGCRIAVDLTPLAPGGENGGVKLLALELVRQLSRSAPEWEFVLLTAARSHDELAELDAANVRRLCVVAPPEAGGLRRRLAAVLPPRVKFLLKSAYRTVFRRSLLRNEGVDLLFCPFTASLCFDPLVPLVAVVCDLQYLYYPQFFSADERYHRDRHFREACRWAERIVCISEYVRGTVLEQSEVRPERVLAIPIAPLPRGNPSSSEAAVRLLNDLGVTPDRFLLYPANFWPHKNHAALLTAFHNYRTRHPASDLRLVCTGAPGARQESVRARAAQMGLDAWVRFPGYLSDAEYSALLSACRAMIFPSLYEGFGMPVAEAMRAGKPVLCSHVASLPEIAGAAALLFDPHRPDRITAAIERLETDPALVASLIEQGRQRAATFGDSAAMAQRYLDVFQEVIAGRENRAATRCG